MIGLQREKNYFPQAQSYVDKLKTYFFSTPNTTTGEIHIFQITFASNCMKCKRLYVLKIISVFVREKTC